MYKIKPIVSLTVLLLTTLACNYVAPTQAPQITVTPVFTPTSLPLTVIVEPTSSRQQTEVPFTEATIPRVTIEEALTAMTAGAAVIVDVRSTQSYAVSHIKNAISIPLSEIETNPTGLNLDKDEWIITYCTWLNEHTSARAAFVLLNNGYTNVTPILGGFQSWLDAGFPVEP